MSLADMIRRMDRLETDLARLRNQVPVRLGMPTNTIIPVLTDTLGSDLLTTVDLTEYKGIQYNGTIHTEVPQVDPTSLTTFPPGLGRAKYLGVWVWVGISLKPSTTNIYDLFTSIPNNQVFLSHIIVDMPVTGSPGVTAPVYLPFAV